VDNILRGRVSLVTGSSRSIGAAIACAFAEQGSSVVIHGRDRAALSALRARIEGAGGRAFSVVGDVTSFEQIEAMRQELERELGPVDILVANAGGSFTPPASLGGDPGRRLARLG
jgi:3-oxoacyl-[acyl-carrier protein] reductase